MLDDTTASWWYEQDGQQAGPVTAAALGRLAAEGRLGPAHRVWRDGMAGWEPLGSVAELAEALRQPRQPAAPPPRSGSPSTFGRPRAAPAAGPDAPGAGFGVPTPSGRLEEISPGVTVLLSVVTFGIYGLVKFHQTGKGYEALAGRPSTFTRDFWLCVGLGIASGLGMATVVVGGALSIASLVFGFLALSGALALREEALRRAGARPALTEAGTHKVLFVAGCLLSPILVGLVLLLVQAWKWFADWNAVGAALARGAVPAETIAAPGR